jgi:glucose-1-phosphate thymidylyltransferase
LIGREFIGASNVALALGDNIFYGHGFAKLLDCATRHREGATVFGYPVKDPQRYGVVGFDARGRATTLEEKPACPNSSYAVTGLYFYDSRVFDIAAALNPSERGELEITDVNLNYLRARNLRVVKMVRGIARLDTGTHDALLQASNFIHAIEERQGLQVACVEEIAWRMGYITGRDVLRLATAMGNSSYGQYLMRMLEQET